jgi:hypothetical protein
MIDIHPLQLCSACTDNFNLLVFRAFHLPGVIANHAIDFTAEQEHQ